MSPPPPLVLPVSQQHKTTFLANLFFPPLCQHGVLSPIVSFPFPPTVVLALPFSVHPSVFTRFPSGQAVCKAVFQFPNPKWLKELVGAFPLPLLFFLDSVGWFGVVVGPFRLENFRDENPFFVLAVFFASGSVKFKSRLGSWFNLFFIFDFFVSRFYNTL